MNFTIADIENLNLRREMINGYSRMQVEKILDRIKEDYYEFRQEISDLQNELELMKETVKHYKTIEESMQHTLIIAHSTGESIKVNASEKASNIIHDAEIKARKILEEADLQVLRIKNEYEDVKGSFNCYKLKIQSMLNSLQELLKTSVDDKAE